MWDIGRARSGAPSPFSDPDDGFTFVEVLVTIVLLGTVVLAILTSVQTLIISSRTNREASAVQSALIAAAERVERAPRETYRCADTLIEPIRAAVQQSLGLASGEVNAHLEVGFEHLEGNSWVNGACTGPAADVFQPNLVQRITINVASADGDVTRTIQVVKGDV